MLRSLGAGALVWLAACTAEQPLTQVPELDLDAGVSADARARADAARPDAAVPPGRDAGCAPDADSDLGLDAALFSVEPPSGGCSVATEVVLHGQAFGPVAAVEVGGVPASAFTQVDSRTIKATFAPVELNARGKKLVSVTFEDRSAVELADGFEYLFDEDPVVFVHGFMLSPFQVMVERFKAAGYPDDMLWRIQFSDTTGSNLKNVDELRAYVAEVLNQTGAPRVDLVVHSMGGLSSRLYLQQGGDAFVRDYVSIAGAHHGTDAAYLYFSDGAKEMRPPYACQGDSLNDIQFQLDGCLTDQGRTFFVDETPFGVEEGGPVSYLSISSEQDEFILPSHSSCLNQLFKGDCSDAVNVRVQWLDHATILMDAHVFDLTLAHLRARNRSKP